MDFKKGTTNMTNLKERLQNFRTETEMPLSVICRKINLTTVAIHKWLKGKMNLTADSLSRIDAYLSRFGY